MNKSLTVLDSETQERKFVPFEVKEAGIKAAVGFVSINMMSIILPLDGAYSAVSMFLVLNYGYQCWNFMGNAVTKMELLDNGKQVSLHFGRSGGKVLTVDINDVKK